MNGRADLKGQRPADFSRLGVMLMAAAFGLSGGLRAQPQTALVGKLKAGGVPVRAAVLKGGSLVVSLEYAGAAEMDPEAIR